MKFIANEIILSYINVSTRIFSALSSFPPRFFSLGILKFLVTKRYSFSSRFVMRRTSS